MVLLTPRHPRRRVKVEKTREHRSYPIPLRRVLEPTGVPFWLQETGYHDLLAPWRSGRPQTAPELVLPGLYGRETPHPEEIALGPPPSPARFSQRFFVRWRCDPDGRAGWIRPGLLAARAISETIPPDAVYSVSPPVTAHRIAARVAARLHVPWIADFRSPWRGTAPRAIDMLRAARTLRGATRAGLNIGTLPLYPSFDGGDMGAAADRSASGESRLRAGGSVLEGEGAFREEPRVLVHAGPTGTDGRDPLLLLDALRRLLDAKRINPETFRVRFLGGRDPRLAPAIAARALGGIVTMEPEVPWEVSLETQADASGLLIAVGPGDEGRLPDRMLEALVVRRPVLAFGYPAAQARGFLEATGLGSLHTDSSTLADAIASPVRPFVLNEAALTPYRAVNVAARLAEALRSG